MHFRKKPVVIEAKQWLMHGDHPAVTFLPAGHPAENVKSDNFTGDDYGWCPTLEGGHVVTPGDWIITGVAGEHYPCKPDIFATTYEAADALTGAQPAPAAPSEPMYLQGYRDALAHAAFYVRDHCKHGEEHAETVLNLKLPLAAPAAQPADSAMEVLRSKSNAVQRAHKECAVAFVTYEGSAFDLNEFAQYVTRLEHAIRARALVAKETPHG